MERGAAYQEFLLEIGIEKYPVPVVRKVGRQPWLSSTLNLITELERETVLHADSAENYRSWSPLTEEGYAEKLRLLREAATIPMERWRAPAVLAWLEIALGMPQYGSRCSENIKSGKVMSRVSPTQAP